MDRKRPQQTGVAQSIAHAEHVTTSEGVASLQPPQLKSHFNAPSSSAAPIQKKDYTQSRWNASSALDSYSDKMDTGKLSEKDQTYFLEYEQTADAYLKDWYKRKNVGDGEKKLTGKMFADAAKKTFLKYGDMKYVVPVEMALIQGRLESSLGLEGMSHYNNPFNLGETDQGPKAWVSKMDSPEKGLFAYYDLMAHDYLSDKDDPYDLLETKGGKKGFVNELGSRYASAPRYEMELKALIGQVGLVATGKLTTASVGKGKKNNTQDAVFVKNLLKKVGYWSDGDTDLGAAILKFQTEVMFPPLTEKQKRAVKNMKQKDRDSFNTKEANGKDGVVGPRGNTIGLLYYMAGGGGKAQSGSVKTSGQSKEDQAGENGKKTAGLINVSGIKSILQRLGYVDQAKEVTKTWTTKEVQTALNQLGFECGKADGVSGDLTKTAVEDFQTMAELEVDGVAGKNTKAYLYLAVTFLQGIEKKKAERGPTDFLQEYQEGTIQMPELGQRLIPFATEKPDAVLQVFDQLAWASRDNLAFAMAQHSTNEQLASYDQRILAVMRSNLNGVFNTTSWGANWEAADRIGKILFGKILGLSDKDQKGEGGENQEEDKFTPVELKLGQYWKSQGGTTDCDKFARMIIEGHKKDSPDAYDDFGYVSDQKTKEENSLHLYWEKEWKKGTDRKEGPKSANDLNTLDRDNEEWQMALDYITACLDAGVPVMVGVNHTYAYWKARGNNDKSVDHWLTVVGKGQDKQGKYFTYFDPGTSRKDVALNTKENRLYQDPSTPSVWHDSKKYADADAGGGSYTLLAVSLYDKHRGKKTFKVGNKTFTRKKI